VFGENETTGVVGVNEIFGETFWQLYRKKFTNNTKNMRGNFDIWTKIVL
jgi:hypothetical protein